jgi:hypothetical protein
MSKLKEFGKYILLIIGVYLLTSVLVFIGFNVNYSKIMLNGELPTQISVEKAEATGTSGRIYGYVSNSEDDDVNGKYIKISIYNSEEELLETEYLKIDSVDYGDKRLFKSNFNVNNATSYSISIVNNEE